MQMTPREHRYAEQAPMAQTTGSSPRRILAIDYGRKRIGLALSDELALTAQPLTTLLRSNRQNDLRLLREICRTYAVGHIIVGYPLHMNGEAGDLAGEAARFAIRLKKHLGLSTELVDERLTSWEAEQIQIETNAPPRQSQRSLDDVAAAVLLRDSLERLRSQADAALRREIR